MCTDCHNQQSPLTLVTKMIIIKHLDQPIPSLTLPFFKSSEERSKRILVYVKEIHPLKFPTVVYTDVHAK
ncbi:hypothetical protein BDB01DRAFT_579674 [Pilobolus umbonatus]|nr:hypothetical protein BDB01DRAFT_579674 [Pilobolus umbonatus]